MFKVIMCWHKVSHGTDGDEENNTGLIAKTMDHASYCFQPPPAPRNLAVAYFMMSFTMNY